MKRFGYLEESTGESEALYREEAIEDAIKTVQKFGAIPQTGKIDNATLALMKSPRCGVPDVMRNHRNKRYVLGSKGWRKRHLTFHVANWSPRLGRDSVVRSIQTALNEWGKYARLTFAEANDPRADIIISFARGPHGDVYYFDGPGNVLAHAFFPHESALGGDVHFDDDENWVDRPLKDDEYGVDFFSVAAHELGHSLGLSHSPVQTSVMFPYYTGTGGSTFALNYDDILGMYELYIRGNPDMDIAPPTEPTTPTPATTEYQDEGSEEYTTPRRPWWNGVTTATPRTYPDYTTVSYIGDDETVDKHKEHENRGDKSGSDNIPDICEGNFDAVATLREELFVFKGQYVWRLKERGEIEPGYPVTIQQMFRLPDEIKKIDAAYQRPDGMIIFFTGKNYWAYDGNYFRENSPRPITDYGLPKSLQKIDAVQVWGKNGKTYLYRNDRFWRYNDTTKLMDAGYPMHMGRWRNVPQNLDAATTWKDGYTYFFKGKLFWKFDNDWVVVSDTSPLPAPQTWLGCPEKDIVLKLFS